MRGWALLLSLACTGCVIRAARPGSTIAAVHDDAVPADPSPGCRRGDGSPEGWRALWSGGRERHYLLRLPSKAKGPMPLVLNFHGWLENAREQEVFTFMTDEARTRGMALVYPQGIGWSWNAGSCCGRAANDQVDDLQFVKDLLARLEGELCIDRNRVFATGMSNGALLSYRLACEMSDTFAAIAPVAGVEAVASCTPSRPVSVMAFNGQWDHIVWYGGGGAGRFPSAPETLARWSTRDACRGPPARASWSHGEAACNASDGCADGADVVLCSLRHGGHTWPGGAYFPALGHTSSDLDATDSMLEFFLAHPKRAATSAKR